MPNPLEQITQRPDQPVHDDQLVNATLQMVDADITAANPLPVTVGTGVVLPTVRSSAVEALTIANGAHLSEEFDMREYVTGDIDIPAIWTPADIGFHKALTTGGTFLPAYDDNGNLIQCTVGAAVSRSVSLPPEVAGFLFVKLWSQNAGVDANQGNDRALGLGLKS